MKGWGWLGLGVVVWLGVGQGVGQELTATQRAERDAGWRATIRQELYVPKRLPALEAKTWSTFSPMAGVLADRVTYRTADGMLVPAIVYRPDPAVAQWKGKLPGIVVVNGHGGDKFSWYAFYSGLLFAKAGAMVVTYDPIGEGERNSERRSRAGSHDAAAPLPAGLKAGVSPEAWGQEWGQRLAGLMQVDMMQAAAYLAARPEVDPKRIAGVGYSMGAFVLGLTGAMLPGDGAWGDREVAEGWPRMHTVVLSGGGVFDEVGPGYFDASRLPCQGPPMRSLRGLGDRAAVLYDLNADRGPMLVMNGGADTVMDMAHHPPEGFAAVRARAVALRGTEKDMFTTVVYPGISHRTSWVNKDGVEWLEKQIHFALWSEQEIAAAPVTHVSTWAKANGVDITSNYMREDREGGLDAVGAGFPGIQRKELMVLPEAEWTAKKDELTYEAWAAKTLKTGNRE